MSVGPKYFEKNTDFSSKQHPDRAMPYLIREGYDLWPVLHRHNFIEFLYIKSGSGQETINGRTHALKPGSFSIVLPYQVHQLYNPPQSKIRYYTGGIDLRHFLSGGEFYLGFINTILHYDENIPAYFHFSEKEQPRINDIMLHLHEAYKTGGDYGALMFRAKLIELLLLFDRHRKRIGNSCVSSNEKSIEHAQHHDRQSNLFWSVVNFIHHNSSKDLQLKKIAEEFKTSSSYLSSAFHKNLGIGYVEFLTELRIQDACSLLVSTDMSLTDIAYECGFESYSTFSRSFRKIKNMTALQYRNQPEL